MFGYIRIVIMMVVLAGIAGAFMYVKALQADLAVAKANAAKLETAVQMNEETISSLQSDYARVNQELTTVNEEFASIREQNRVLANKLAKHDLGVLGEAKPGLVGRVINRATEKANRCFEIISGAELTETEKNAKSGQEFNSECPWLWTDSTNP
jgi:chromosome segregation ATPase